MQYHIHYKAKFIFGFTEKDFYAGLQAELASFKFIIQEMATILLEDSSQHQKCCVCYSPNCFQSVDHQPITFRYLTALIQSSKRNHSAINKVKQSLKDNYGQLKAQFCRKVEEDQQIFQEWLNQFYFNHIATERINLPLLCQLAQGNYAQLPTKSLPRLIKILQRHQEQNTLLELPSSFHEAVKFVERMDVQALIEKSLRLLAVQRVIKSAAVDLLSLSSKHSLSEIYSHEDCEHYPQGYQWRNVKIDRNSRTVQLSNKNIKDEDVIREIPKIACFRNIRELEIRNNSITSLSCKVIVSNMSFLQCLDIRGNKVGDKGLEYVIDGMPHLKSLMISETEATDVTGRLVAEKMDNLELFWAEHNHLTGQVILQIGSKPKLKVMSVAGNPIEQRYSSMLHGLFVRKGYIVV